VTPLLVAILAFVGSHFLMSHPLRPVLVARLGERGFTALYSLVALATFAWMIFAWPDWYTVGVPWLAPLWSWPIASAIMLFASILLVGSLIRNPAHPGAARRTMPIPRGVYAITRHPMNWSFILWALVHISLVGDPRNLVVAGGILILALFGSIGQDRKKERLLGEAWRDWEARTSFVPFAAAFAGRARWRDTIPGAIALVGGVIFWALATSYHAPLVSPLGDLLSR
jgi:uncharacterized membrane protein